jgi:hypothetical protein
MNTLKDRQLKLSIVIPTYNRNKILLANIDCLFSQLQDDVELKILDNGSPIPIIETLADIILEYPNANIQIIRNKVNIGAYANIIRSYEVANSPWLWILGDDDIVSPTAIKDILDLISRNPEAAFINFTTDTMRIQGARPVSFDTQGQLGFITGLDHAGAVNFMSIGIWRVDAVIGSLGVGYHYAYSMSPTFVLLLSALGSDLTCHFSHKVLIEQASTVESNGKWQFSDFIRGWNLILELPMSNVARITLAKKMKNWHSPESVCVYLLAEAAVRGKDDRDFRLISNRLAIYSTVFERLRFFCYRLFFCHPVTGWKIVLNILTLMKYFNLKNIDATDIVGRLKSVSNDRR